MTNNRPSIQELWAAQATEGVVMSLEQIQARSAKFQQTVRNRNLREYIAAGVVLLGFGFYAVMLPGLFIKLGSVMIILGTLVVVWQLHKRGSARAEPLEGSVLDYIAFYRGEMVRQRDAVKSVAVWYLGPLVPGMVVFSAGRWATLAIVAVVFVLVWLLNRWGAARLQKLIDALDRMASE